METIEREFTHKGHTFKFFYDEYPCSPREDDNIGTLAIFNRDIDHNESDFSNIDSCIEYLEENKNDLYILKIVINKHSNYHFETSKLNPEIDDDCDGYIYCTKEKVETEGVSDIEEFLKAELETYESYVNGECFFYAEYNESGELLESVGGYIGFDALDDLEKELKS